MEPERATFNCAAMVLKIAKRQVMTNFMTNLSPIRDTQAIQLIYKDLKNLDIMGAWQ